MPASVAIIIGVILAIAATVVAFIMIVPAKKRAGLNKFLQWVHDLCNFKSLLIEQILKVLYVFNTAFCIGVGFFMLFSVVNVGGYYGYSVYVGWIGILLLIFGPIIVRLIFEGMMLAILHLRNTMEINDKLVPQPGSRAEEKLKAAKQKEEEEAARAQFQQQFQQAYQQQVQQQAYQQPAQPYQAPNPGDPTQNQ